MKYGHYVIFSFLIPIRTKEISWEVLVSHPQNKSPRRSAARALMIINNAQLTRKFTAYSPLEVTCLLKSPT